MDYLEATISQLKIYTKENWLYMTVDKDNMLIIHMGTTTLHPIAQIEKHITEGLLRNNENKKVKLYAYPIPKRMNKEVIKKMVINELEQSFVDIGEDFEGETLEHEIWKEHIDFSIELVAKINGILSD